MSVSDRRQLLFDFTSVALVYFLDVFILSLVYPIFGSVVLSPYFGSAFGNIPFFVRPLIFGCLTASFPLAQYLGFFHLEALSKNHARRKIVFFSLLGIFIGLIITALGIHHESISFLFLGRIVSGYFAGNILLAYCFCLYAPDYERSFTNHLNTLTGLALVFGVAIGGCFSETHLHVHFTNNTPILMAAGLSICIALTYWFLSSKEVRALHISILEAVKFKKSMSSYKPRYLFSFFLFLLTWFATLQFIGLYFLETYATSRLFITITFMIMGTGYLLGYFGFYPLVARTMSKPKQRAQLLLFCLTLFSIAMVLIHNAYFAATLHILFGIFAGCFWNFASEQLDDPDREKHQTYIGFKLAMLLLAAILSPLIAGLVAMGSIRLVYLLTFCLLFGNFSLISFIRSEQ